LIDPTIETDKNEQMKHKKS